MQPTGSFGQTTAGLKMNSVAGAAVDQSTHAGYDRAYWTKGLITNSGLLYLPHKDNQVLGPATHHLGSTAINSRAPAFAPLREPHLRPKETFGHERRFRDVERLGIIKSGIHDLALPGPGLYVRPEAHDTRYVESTGMAPNGGILHPTKRHKMAKTSFGSTATGIGAEEHERSDTPRGRGSWIQGAVLGHRSGAPDVMVQEVRQTKHVVSDHLADLRQTHSTFLHSSFNARSQKNARSPLRKVILERTDAHKGVDSRGQDKMNRHAPQTQEMTRTANAMM